MKVVRSSASRTGHLYPQEMFLVLIFTRGLSRPQGHGTVGRKYVTEENPVIPPGIDPGTVRLVAQRLNHYATPGPWFKCNGRKIQAGNGQRLSGIEEDCVGRRGTERTVVREVGEGAEEEEVEGRRRKKRKREK